MRAGVLNLFLAMGVIACLLPVAGWATASGPERIRAATKAGTWYPGDSEQLARLVDEMLNEASPPPIDGAPVRVLIAPHAGYPYSGTTAASAYKLVRGKSYRRVIVLGPDHRSGFRGLSVPDVTHYRTPLGKIPLDLEALAELKRSPLVVSGAGHHSREHSVEIQLPLLQRTLAPGWKLVPILVGDMAAEDYTRAAEALRPLADGDTLVVISADFTHYGPAYGYIPFPPDRQVQDRIRELDMGAYERITARDPSGLEAYHERTGITACGIAPIRVVLEMLPETAQVALADYHTSGEMTGDYRHSVSYLAIAITDAEPIAGPPETQRFGSGELELLHRLACHAVTAAVVPGAGAEQEIRALVAGLPESLRAPGSAFVTLKQQGRLRGCIGTVLPKEPLYRAVLTNARAAALQDPRFVPVRPQELPTLAVSVSVLSPTKRITSAQDCTVGKQGVVLSKEGRRGLFLPSVAREQGCHRTPGATGPSWRSSRPRSTRKSGPLPTPPAAGSCHARAG
jgi:AmmeMemoRadiSam system protein B/AmmeMemoRadiSam system protein A